MLILVLSVTILETTKTNELLHLLGDQFYRSQFWRLQKQGTVSIDANTSFIGHNFGDYKNRYTQGMESVAVLSVTILETTKTSNGIS